MNITGGNNINGNFQLHKMIQWLKNVIQQNNDGTIRLVLDWKLEGKRYVVEDLIQNWKQILNN